MTACSQETPTSTETEVLNTATTTPSPSPSSTTRPKTPTATATPEPVSKLDIDSEELRGTSIQFWHIWDGETGDLLTELIDEFNISNQWGIIVVPSFQGTLDNLFSNVNTALESGDDPDLVVGYLHQAQVWDAVAEFPDLNIYIEDPIWGFSSEEQNDFYPVFWNHDQSEGKRLGIPAQRSGQVLFYNASWAGDLGFDTVPTTPEQFLDQACAAANANQEDNDPDNDTTGGWIISTNYAATLGWIYAFGGEIVISGTQDTDGSVYQFETQEVDDTFTFLRELYDQGCAWFADNSYPEAEFANRQGLFMTQSVSNIPFQMDAFQAADNKDQWTVLPFPSPDGNPAFDAYGPSFEILKSTPERQLAAWLFIKWLLAPENQARLIEKMGTLPIRTSTLENLADYESTHPQWAVAVKALPYARSEPTFQSWSVVRWALTDALKQLFMYYFTIDQVPVLVEFLDQTAHELHIGPEKSGVLDTPTFTPTASYTPTDTPFPSATISTTPSPKITRTPLSSESPSSSD
jgi:ABC-type glycerol-3-phosphate transport system substrate-binding protein